jgi:hypothetical protein
MTARGTDRHPIRKTIFDTRPRKGEGENDSIKEFVKLMNPDLLVVYQPWLNEALFGSNLTGTELACAPTVQSLNPAFVRGLLKLPVASSILKDLNDGKLGNIIDFALDGGPADNLVGCYGLRTATGTLFKLDRDHNSAGVANIVDNAGFMIFGASQSHRLIRPSFLSNKTRKILDSQSLDIRRPEGSDIDRFL